MQLPSLFGWLWSIKYFAGLPQATQLAIQRALKAGASVAIGILLAEATAGTLLPASWSPAVVLAVTMVLQSVDKFLRESQTPSDQGDGGTQ